MQHIKDISYKGYELCICKDSTGYSISVEANSLNDDYIIARWSGFGSIDEAIARGEECVEFVLKTEEDML